MAYHGMVHDSPVITMAHHMHKVHMSANDANAVEFAGELGSMIDRWIAKRTRKYEAKMKAKAAAKSK